MTDEELENERFSCASIDEKSDPAYPWARLAERLMDALTAARRERDEARMLQASADEETRRVRSDLEAAERERDEALAKYQFMVDRAADQKLDGYRELAARAADAENRRDEALRAVSAQVEENEHLRVRIAEAEQRGRDAERRRVRAAVEQMMADAVHVAADARQQCVDYGETRIRLDDRARASGKLDTCECVLQVLDAAPAPTPPDVMAALAEAERLLAKYAEAVAIGQRFRSKSGQGRFTERVVEGFRQHPNGQRLVVTRGYHNGVAAKHTSQWLESVFVKDFVLVETSEHVGAAGKGET